MQQYSARRKIMIRKFDTIREIRWLVQKGAR